MGVCASSTCPKASDTANATGTPRSPRPRAASSAISATTICCYPYSSEGCSSCSRMPTSPTARRSSSSPATCSPTPLSISLRSRSGARLREGDLERVRSHRRRTHPRRLSQASVGLAACARGRAGLISTCGVSFSSCRASEASPMRNSRTSPSRTRPGASSHSRSESRHSPPGRRQFTDPGGAPASGARGRAHACRSGPAAIDLYAYELARLSANLDERLKAREAELAERQAELAELASRVTAAPLRILRPWSRRAPGGCATACSLSDQCERLLEGSAQLAERSQRLVPRRQEGAFAGPVDPEAGSSQRQPSSSAGSHS